MPSFQDWRVAGYLDQVRRDYLTHRGESVKIVPHQLTLSNAAAVVPGDTQTNLVRMPSDGHFLWFGTSSFWAADNPTAAGVQDQRPQFRVQFTQLQNARVLTRTTGAVAQTRQWVALDTICGRLRSPFLWPVPAFFIRGDGLQVEYFVPATVAGNVTFPDLVLHGFKLLLTPIAGQLGVRELAEAVT